MGTYISYNKQLADQYNFVYVITYTKTVSIWSLRGLSLAGGIQVSISLAFSKAVFICTLKPYSKKFVDDPNVIQKDFIWRCRKVRKHTSQIGDYNEGCMKDKDKAGILANTWIKRLTDNKFHSWKIIPNVLLKAVGGVSYIKS